MTTIAIAGGGTGGHVYPALAIGEALAKRGHTVIYYGDPSRLEGEVIPKRGLPFRPISAVAYPRRGLWGKVRFLFGLLRAVWQTRKQLKRDGIQAVIGVGGYISAPPVLAARWLGIPRAVHEANVVPGLANRLCGRFADLVLLSYESSRKHFVGRRTELVGCPVRPGITQGDRAASLERYGLPSDLPVLLVVGGSLGAAKLNALAIDAANHPERQYAIVHITGPRYHDSIVSALDPVPPNVALVGYEHDMAGAYAAADLVISRAGSSTLAELTALGKPAVLIPSPNVTDNHQEANARGLETSGAALVFTEQELETNRAALACIDRLLRDKQTLKVMAEASGSLGRLDTADTIGDLVESELLGLA
jgi:UDP-N-acetylglucosamine--N-acetylmuramyl-(pentapeptide) pyrophosphoryl-undecaprenol N-acetylglucosamine transferase